MLLRRSSTEAIQHKLDESDINFVDAVKQNGKVFIWIILPELLQRSVDHLFQPYAKKLQLIILE